MSTLVGARPDDWLFFDLALGLGDNLLPVVNDPNVEPTPGSKVKKFGKIPSMYDREGRAHGLPEWQKMPISPGNLDYWSADGRYSMCLRLGPLSGVYAIDVDVDDSTLCDTIDSIIECAGSGANLQLPMRTRAGTHKHLFLFRYHEPISKIIIDWGRVDAAGKPERIEILGDGQQCVVAGSHPSGTLYEWDGPDNLPADIPHLDQTEFPQIVERLCKQFGTSPSGQSADAPGTSTGVATAVYGGEVLSSITPGDRVDLTEALNWQPLLDNCRDNTNWSEIGYALLSLGDVGRGLWLSFSERAPGADSHEAGRDWWAAHESAVPRSDYRHIFSLARALGWRAGAPVTAFSPVEEQALDGDGEVEVRSAGETSPVGDIPLAQDLCTDLANARRIQQAYGAKLCVVASAFYIYDGKRWVRDDSEANRMGARLSSMIRSEADAAYANVEAILVGDAALGPLVKAYRDHPRPDQSPAKKELRATAAGEALLKWLTLSEKLRKWMKASEDAGRITAALGLVKRMLTVEPSKLDAHHHLLNCNNGTVDLRSGELRPHSPDDWLTQIAPTDYYPDAKCPDFERFLVEILDVERARFLQRWFGYCATGETREQKVVLHIGPGGNGKGTLFRILADTLGSYVHTAAPHLLTGSGSERHPTEIADLFGRRCVVSHESDEGAILREGFLKQASGEDMLSGRWMFKDFFSFMPTFKLQLLTNHKPVVKGQDFGVWRRLLLVNYDIRYGTPEQVEKGEADRVGDETLTSRLLVEREGVLAWLVRGARDWYNFKLRAPQSVYDASVSYRNEQDRVREYVADRCILDRNAWSPFNGPFALYPEYTRWCKDSGFQPLAMTRFVNELQRVIGTGFRRDAKKTKQGNVWKTFKGCYGVRVNLDQDGGGVVENEDYGDLL